jgi:salicylate hydroxylase
LKSRRSVLIAGAGIGGLAAALTLTKRGFKCQIVERAPALLEVGAGLQISPNASRILDGLGLGPALDAAGARPDAVRIIDGRSGKAIASVPLGVQAEKRWAAPYRVIHRADLQRILSEAALAAGVDIRLGAEVVDFAQVPAGVLAHLRTTEGEETPTADLLIGADGVYSSLRGRLGAPPPRFSGQIAWRAIIDLPSRNETGLWLGPGAHLVSYSLNQRGQMNLVAITHGADARPGWSEPRQAGELLQCFRGWAPAAQALIRAAPVWTVWPLYDQEPGALWGAGPTTLMGDAAHGMLPHLAQGAAMAIEDAAALADALAASPDRPELALRNYEDERQPRTHAAILQSRRNGQIYRMSGLQALARDTALRLMGTERLTRRLDWLYGYGLPAVTQPTNGA